MTATSELGSYGCWIHRTDVTVEQHKRTTRYNFRLIGTENDERLLLGMDIGDHSFSLHLPREALLALQEVLDAALLVKAPAGDEVA